MAAVALADSLNELLDRIRATRAPVTDVWNVPGPSRGEVERRLLAWAGYAPDELVTWFSTINGLVPNNGRDWHCLQLVCMWQPVGMDRAIAHSQRFAGELEQWRPTYIELLTMDPSTLYVDAAADPVVTPVYRWDLDDDQHIVGFRLAESLEDLVLLWLELFDHGMYFDPDHHAGWIIDRVQGLSIRALRAGWSGSVVQARRALAQVDDQDS